MKFSIGNESHEIDDVLLSAIVRAIDKAVSEDVPNQLRELNLETNNYIAFIRGDFINQNLRNLAIEEGGLLHSFQRYGWSGRLLISRDSRLTISITTESNLAIIPRKQRTRPHFTQSILHRMNGDLHGQFEQTRLFNTEPFDDEVYAKDFDDIINGAFEPEDGYRHCVVAYRVSGNELVDVKLVVLDPWFNIVTEVSLIDYMKPDFARLTASVTAENEAREEHNAATRQLTSVKTGIKPTLREGEKKA